MKVLSDSAILDSWNKNVSPWVAAIRNGEINSRVDTTNLAILETILKTKPSCVLDLGCGEGWLVRELTKMGIDTLGTDAVEDLIEAAKKEGGGKYEVLSYEDLSFKTLEEKYDVIVSNFSLLGNESVHTVFDNVGALLNSNGYLIVQTIHPLVANGKSEYKDGWREGSWSGFNESFTDPAPWYFRTIESWKSLFENNGFMLESVHEPMNPDAIKPSSIIFVGKITSNV